MHEGRVAEDAGAGDQGIMFGYATNEPLPTKFGKSSKSKGCWIRAISVPKVWIQAGPGGERIYREVFERLIAFGATALGLYRAGDVKVRMQMSLDPNSLDGKGVASLNSPPAEPNVIPGDDALKADIFSSPEMTGNDGFEMGGDSTIVDLPPRSYEHSALLQSMPTYGAADDDDDGWAHRDDRW